MARAVVRFSLNYGEANKKAGTKATASARKILTGAGFEKIGTSSYEADGQSHTSLTIALGRLLLDFDQLPRGVKLDHLWVYLDAPKRPN
jgi:hypothetical protein